MEVLIAPAAFGQLENVIEEMKGWSARVEKKDSFVRVIFRRKKTEERAGA